MQKSDLEDFHILRTQFEVMKWTTTGKVDTDREATEIWMNRSLPPNDGTTFNFALEELSNPGVVIGAIGCHQFEPPECGYMLRTEFWRKGYATEAFQRWLQAWWELPRREIVVEDPHSKPGNAAEAVFVPEVLRADVDAVNVASARILSGCGFRPISEEVVEHNGASVTLVTLQLERPKSY
jgi:RimJ/RimL family protein N-acetyltransferase